MEIKVAIGEIIDKLTILAIKKAKITDSAKLKNIIFEYDYLKSKLDTIQFDLDSDEYKELYDVNLKLWDIEEGLRENERNQTFGEEFITIARNESKLNDVRAKIKKRINTMYESEIVEEKSYQHL